MQSKRSNVLLISSALFFLFAINAGVDLGAFGTGLMLIAACLFLSGCRRI